MAYSRVYFPRSTVFSALKPIEIENAEVSEILWSKIKKLNENNNKSPEELLHHW